MLKVILVSYQLVLLNLMFPHIFIICCWDAHQ
jgi:hypothetical protein